MTIYFFYLFSSFSLPPDSGERMTVVVTNLLCFALFMLMTTEVLPQNSDHVPIISIFYLVLMVESCLSVFLACCVLIVYYRGRQETPPEVPPWLGKFFLKMYAKIFKKDTTRWSSKQPVMIGIQRQVRLLLGLQHIVPSEDLLEETTPLDQTSEFSLSDELSKVVNCSSSSDLNNQLSTSSGSPTSPSTNAPELSSILSEVRTISASTKMKRNREGLRDDWEMIGYMLDRVYFWLFMVLVIVSSASILAIAYHTKTQEISSHAHLADDADGANVTDSAISYFDTPC